MSLGGLAVSVGLMCIGAGLFVLTYPEVLVDSSFGPTASDAEARRAGITARRWAQFRGALAVVVGVGLLVVGFASMF